MRPPHGGAQVCISAAPVVPKQPPRVPNRFEVARRAGGQSAGGVGTWEGLRLRERFEDVQDEDRQEPWDPLQTGRVQGPKGLVLGTFCVWFPLPSSLHHVQ